MADYVTVAVLKDFMGEPNSTFDAALGLAVTAASRAIDRWCERPVNGFVGQTQTRYYDVVSSSGPLDLDPLTSITSLATDDEADGTYGTVWTASDYQLLPLNAAADGLPYTQVRTTPTGDYAFPVGPNLLKIIGVFGEVASTTTPPPSIQHATMLVAHRLFQRRKSALGLDSSAVELGGTSRTIPSLDPDVKALLVQGGYMVTWGVV